MFAEQRDEDTVPVLHSELQFGVRDYVRLHGLKSEGLNRSIGEIVDYVEVSKRYGVLLHGTTSPKAIKESNLVSYSVDSEDVCASCREPVNLFSFPSCNCPPNRTSECHGVGYGH